MDRQVRRKLAMAASVRTFSRAHPSPDASYTLVLERLDNAILRIEGLAKQQEGGNREAGSVRSRTAVERKKGHLTGCPFFRPLVSLAE